MKTIIFDVDDTLYDQIIPFEKAVKDHFLDFFKNDSINDLYKINRKLSDEVFHLTENGKMGLEEMRIYRITNALKYFGISIDRIKAKEFQESYQMYQSKIELLPDVIDTLDFCQQNNIPLGIITNGPKKHQRKKIKQLQLSKWIPEKSIIISSEVGYAKPDKKIFEFAEKKLSLIKEKTIYVGDSFSNDIVGAKSVGWQTIWINRRDSEQMDKRIEPDFYVDNNNSLFSIVKSLHE